MTTGQTREALARRVEELEGQVAALEATARKYQTLFGSFPQGISVSDADGKIVETNEAAEGILGVDRREHEGRELDGPEWRIVDAAGNDLPPERWASVVALGERRPVLDQEMGVSRPDGVVRWLNVSAAPLPAEDGGVVVTYNDITDRKRAVSALRESEANFRVLAESAPVSILMLRDGVFVYANPAAARMLGYPGPEDLVGVDALSVVAPGFRDTVRERMRAIDSGRDNPAIDVEFLRADGGSVWTRSSSAVVVVAGARSAIVVSQETTEQRRAEDELRRKERMLARTESIAHIGSWQWEVATDQVTWSDELFRIFGRDPAHGAVSYAEHDSLYLPEDMARLDRVVRRAVEHAEPYELEMRTRRQDGQIRHCRVHGFPEVGATGRVERLYGSVQDITDQRHARKELERLAHDLTAILDHVPAYIYFKDIENNILAISKSVAEATGLPVEEIVGRHSSEVYPDTAERYWSDDLEVVRSGQPKTGILEPLPVAGGELRWLLTDKIPYFDPEGNVIGIIVMAADITDRVSAERRLQESESKFHSLFEFAADAVYHASMDGRFLDVNAAARRQTGYSREELLQMTVANLDPRAIADDDRGRIWNELESGQSVTIQSRHRRKDGSTFPAEISISIIDIGGERTLQGVVRDQSERIRMLEELRLSEERLSLAFQGANDGLWDWNMETDEVFFSPRWKSMLGCEDHEIANEFREWERLVHPEDRPKAWEALNAYLRGERPSFECEFRMQHRDGAWIEVLSRAFAIRRESDDKPVRVVGTHVDITERKEMQRRLLRAQRLESIGQLAGGIAHDFNNILQPIMGLSELLLEDLPRDGRERENVGEILAASKRGRDLVERILAFSRQADARRQPIRIQKILDEVVRMARATIPTSIEISHRIASDCGVVVADATQIHQVAMNLVTNAFHAVDQSGGRIDLELEELSLGADEAAALRVEAGRYVRLRVADNGCGIAPENLDKIFEPYFTTKEPGKGTGIGLSTVYGIVQDHGGAIQVRSEPGRGSTFDVYLPLMARTDPAAPVGPASELRGGRDRILLVDDDEAIARLEKHVLERLGYEVTALTSSRELVARFAADTAAYDLVITDMTMPELTGDRVAAAVHDLRPGIPIIVCTGDGDRIDGASAAAMGIRGILLKPVSREDLARKVREVLDMSVRG